MVLTGHNKAVYTIRQATVLAGKPALRIVVVAFAEACIEAKLLTESLTPFRGNAQKILTLPKQFKLYKCPIFDKI
jgi:hypothetical protein